MRAGLALRLFVSALIVAALPVGAAASPAANYDRWFEVSSDGGSAFANDYHDDDLGFHDGRWRLTLSWSAKFLVHFEGSNNMSADGREFTGIYRFRRVEQSSLRLNYEDFGCQQPDGSSKPRSTERSDLIRPS